ncbi:MAG: SurA N-terminal domain-containing protein, partial [Blastocatellia bacterium]
MKRFGISFCVLTFVALSAFSAFGQETEERVVDEVVAQVNEGVITLSRIKREIKSAVDTKVQDGTSRPEAERIVKEKQGELIANMINEELLLQRAKEMKLDSDVEASINQRFLQIMKQNNLKTLDALFQEMQKTGVDPQEIRELWRKQETRNEVLRREVQMKVYWGFNGKQLKEYFEKNKARFTKPETVTISEVFLSFA